MKKPQFFLPPPFHNRSEDNYLKFARWCNCSIPTDDRRVFSITFKHNGVEWTATVGEQLHGTRRHPVKSKAFIPPPDRLEPLNDPATVLAIFEGNPFFVVTNKGYDPDVRSLWENPFMAGQPESVHYFAT